ncbi:protein kinase [Luteolibacter sp. GHJ8]|uniref:Protein kinase n=1 Tax=Luteolibacter rhizosphaerae TaxID=2989719 RepID=A0ABT3G0D6_9BACT|nr:serine/threonine-protein kinase [Luteolibacter rhizosphaerae]MCW1913300.1 protein kinase [Luteolibacter rhizosphaerae]
MSTDSFEAPSLEMLAALLPAYDFEAFIAQGGMGAVYKARQRSLDRDVAIKILPRELGEDPEFRQSFETEAKAMARLNHPNLIGVYDYGDVDGMPYIVMEFVNGKSLFHSAYQMAVDPIQAVTIVKGICDGLAHAHENGVIHRDIKPANILLNEKVTPKIGDFGLARPAGNSTGIVMGTPGYVAPEVLHHPDHADRRSDLFALGVVLYELLIGRCPPYDYQPPASVVCGCDVTLDRICDKAMNRIADLRYQSAEEMSADLDAWMRRATNPAAAAAAPAAPKGRIRRVGAMSGGYRPSKAESSSGGMKGLLGLAAVVAVGAIGWSMFSNGQKAQTAGFQAAAAQVPPAADDKSGSSKPKADKKAKSDDATAKKETNETPMESLGRLREKLASGNREEMPKGATLLGDRYFMVVSRPLSWTAASSFATMHGAQLFMALTPADLRKVSALMPEAESGAEAGLWIGAGMTGADAWMWVDGSPWELSVKPGGEGVYVIVDAQGAPQMRERVDRYPFVIQWRKDGASVPELPDALVNAGENSGKDASGSKDAAEDDALSTEDLPEEIASLDKIAKDYLAKLDEERSKKLAENAKSFTWGIDSWHKDLSKNDQATWNRDVTLLKTLVKENRVPDKIGPDSGVRLSPKMEDLAKRAAAKQKEIDADFDSKAERARTSYAARMADRAKSLAGNPKAAKAAEARVKKAAELKGWVSFVKGEEAGEEEEEVMEASAAIDGAELDLSGRWVWMSADIVIIRPDGSLFNETNKNKGEWKREEPGSDSYQFSWNNGRWVDVVTVSADGNKMNGKNQIGNTITAWRILKGSDPIVDAWQWGNAKAIFRSDSTVSKGNDGGKWTLDSEEGGTRTYTVRWGSGYTDTFTLAKNGDSFKGTNNHGAKISGERIEE